MSTVATVVACLAVLTAAIPFSTVGFGGGVAYVPILLAAGIEFRAASTDSQFIIMMASLAATLAFGRKKTVDWNLLFAIVPLSILGSFAGGYVAQFVSVVALKIIFAAVVIVAAFSLLRPATEGKSPSFMPQWLRWNRTCGAYQYQISMGLFIPTTVVSAFIAGILGVGGGLFLLPLLVLLFGCPTRLAISVSSTYVGITTLAGFMGHMVGGSAFNIWIAIPLAVAAFVGASLGPMLSLKANINKLRIILVIVLVGISVWMVANIF